MHRYDSIKKLSRSGRVNNIFGSVIPNIAHIAFSPNKTWDMRICTFEFASQSGFLNTVCDLLFCLQSAPPVVTDASYTKPTRHPSARFESRCMFKRKSPHFCSDETLTLHKKVFGMCTNITPSTFSRGSLQEWKKEVVISDGMQNGACSSRVRYFFNIMTW